MSINDFMNKIKGKIGIDGTTIMCLLIVIFVGLSSFGLGRLSMVDKNENYQIKLEDKNLNIVKGEIGNSVQAESNIKSVVGSMNKLEETEKMYVASKNGKLYYGVDCSGAKRIAEKNQVWFASREDAEKSGYTLSSSCK